MSDIDKNKGATPKRPPDSPASSSKRLRDRVSFYEKVWTGSGSSPSSLESDDSLNVEELEKKLADDRSRHLEHAHIEHVHLRQTPTPPPLSPRHLVQHLQEIKPDGSVEETLIETVEEGDTATGMKTVKFEKVTVRKSVKQITSTTSSTVRTISSSRTPSEEHVHEDSAYQTHTNGSGLSHSKSSSISSLTGRFPSEESLRRTPSRENENDWETSSNSSSKVACSSSEWYNEYRTQSFQTHSPTKRDYFRSKSEYDHHIATIRGQYS